MMAIVSTELRELVDAANERLDAEYKAWLDLAGDHEARADLARHLAAIANYGGGYVVFGIDDEMKYAGANSYPSVRIDRDLVASIVKRYLDPTFQCDVLAVPSAAGNDHPVIIVPPHGAYPICAKSDGPQIKGRVSGIKAGTYYTRKAGPESAPILTPAEWAPIVRRCALHERSAILGAVDAALRAANAPVSPSSDTRSAVDELKVWHDAAHTAFLGDLDDYAGREQAEASPELARRHYQFSYAIHRGDGAKIDHGDLLEVLRQVNHEAGDISESASWLFYPYTRPEISPRFRVDPATGLGEEDFLECSLLRDPDGRTASPTFWRVSTDGKGTIIESYLEDQVDWCRQLGVPVASWFSPNLLVRRLAEFVRYARGMAERFDSAINVSIRCEWYGVAQRQMLDPFARWHEPQRARDDRRSAVGDWPITALAGDWSSIVSQLAAPVVRAFVTRVVATPEWVRGQAPTWRR
jgi:hypothetical protein